MKKNIISLLFVFISFGVHAQYGSIAVFEKGADDKIKIVRIFPAKSTINDLYKQDGADDRIRQSVNNYMHLDGKIVYTAFFIPFTDYLGTREFVLKEYVSKKDAKTVRFIKENEEILLNEKGEVISSREIPKPLGTIISYFHNGTEIYQWAACEVWGKSLTKSPGDLAKECQPTGARGGTLVYEWKPGLDWYAAEKAARQHASKFALPGHYSWLTLDDYGRDQLSKKQTGYTVKEKELIDQGKQPDGEKIDFSKEDYVDNLPPATINKFKSYIKEEESRLRSQGWERFGSRYDYAEHLVNQMIYEPRQDRGVSVIVVTEDTSAMARITQNYVDLASQKIGQKNYAVYYDLHSQMENRGLKLFVENLSKSKIPVGLIFYKRKPTFDGDLLSLLFDAKKGFSFFKAGLLKVENGKQIFAGTKTLGHLHAELSMNTTLNLWEYIVYTDKEDKDAAFYRKRMENFFEAQEKQGRYIVRKRNLADKNVLYTEVFDKNGNLVFTSEEQTIGSKKNKWTFFEQK